MLGLECIHYIRNFLLISITFLQKTVGYFFLEPLFNSIVDNLQPPASPRGVFIVQ